MDELSALIAAGVLTPGRPTTYELADGPKALVELETRATVGKLALLPDAAWPEAGTDKPDQEIRRLTRLTASFAPAGHRPDAH
jgi:hypothetical protein